MPAPPLSHRARTTVYVALGIWTAVLAVTLLAPSAAGPSWLVETVAAALTRVGTPEAVASPERVEFLLNVAAFVPLSLLGSIVWPRLTWRDWTAAGFVASFLVEVVQAVTLDARSAAQGAGGHGWILGRCLSAGAVQATLLALGICID